MNVIVLVNTIDERFHEMRQPDPGCGIAFPDGQFLEQRHQTHSLVIIHGSLPELFHVFAAFIVPCLNARQNMFFIPDVGVIHHEQRIQRFCEFFHAVLQ